MKIIFKSHIAIVLTFCIMVSLCGCTYSTPSESTAPASQITNPTGTTAVTDPVTESTVDATIPTTEETMPPVTQPETEPPATEPETIPPTTEQETVPPMETTESVIEETVPVEPEIQYPIEYRDETCTITITREWYENAWCYIAHLRFTDYTRFGTACANGKYDNGYETTSHAAERLGAIFAVNGCYSAPYLNYSVVRSGTICNGADRNCWLPAVYSSNSGLFLSAWESGGTPGISGENLSQLVEQGLVTDTFCFGAPFLTDGIPVSSENCGSRAQRTFVGTNGDPSDLWVVVSEGRYVDDTSAGLTYHQCAKLLLEKGCVFGIPLDGGGSSTMVFQGEVLNSAKDNERAVVDFVYFK